MKLKYYIPLLVAAFLVLTSVPSYLTEREKERKIEKKEAERQKTLNSEFDYSSVGALAESIKKGANALKAEYYEVLDRVFFYEANDFYSIYFGVEGVKNLPIELKDGVDDFPEETFALNWVIRNGTLKDSKPVDVSYYPSGLSDDRIWISEPTESAARE